jgi:NAD(P)-dependent dehydrogenase (short-subunit alcohol dehydrogenase family)
MTTTSLITGANRGIGLELCKTLHAKGHRVIGVCRKSSPELDALGVRVEAGVDTSDEAALHALAARLADTPIDWLIANAGILRGEVLGSLDAGSLREQIEVNAIGTLLTVEALLPRLHAGSKIALITSRMGSIGDNTSGGFYGYRMSKAALNAAGMSLAHDLRPRKIGVVILHPGYVRTDMTGRSGGVEPAESAAMLVKRIDELTLESSGSFLHANGERLPW